MFKFHKLESATPQTANSSRHLSRCQGLCGVGRVVGLLGAVVLMAPLAPAQQAATPPASATQTADLYRAAYQQFNQTRATDAAGAVQEALKFLRAHPSDSVATRNMSVSFYELVALTQASSLKDAEAGLATIEEAAQTLPGKTLNVTLLGAKTQILNRLGRFAEAETILTAAWPSLVISDAQATEVLPLLLPYMTALNKQKKSEQALQLAQLFANQHPLLLTNPVLIKNLTEQLLVLGRADEALQWGKLYFMLVPYDEKSLGNATQLLLHLWTAQSLTSAKAQKLVAAMQDATGPNPLREISLPDLDTQTLQKQATQASRAQDRISLLIMNGRDRDAMIEAQKLVLSAPNSALGAQEVCRVFKAHDLGLQRANAFADYFKTGDGENPVTAFLQET